MRFWLSALRVFAVILPVALAACSRDEDTAEDESLIPRAELFGRSFITAAQLSPDGRFVSFIRETDGVSNIWLKEADADATPRRLTSAPAPGVKSHAWHPSGEAVLYLRGAVDSNDWHAYVTRVATSETRNLTPISGVQARFLAFSDEAPERAYLALSGEGQGYSDIYRVNLRTGSRLLVVENEGAAGYLAGPDLDPLIAQIPLDGGGFRWEIWDEEEEAWRVLGEVDAADSLGTVIDQYDLDGTQAILRDRRGAEAVGLARLDLETGETGMIARPERSDISQVLYDPESGAPIAYATDRGRRHWRAFNAETGDLLRRMGALAPGDLTVLDASADGRHWLISLDATDEPPSYFLFDREADAAIELGLNEVEWRGAPTVRQRPVTLSTRDGQEMIGYLSLPAERKIDAEGRPDEPSPLVIVVHGGPWERQNWEFSEVHQWLANRGYAALSVNYRGSFGFGRAFETSADRKWATVFTEDLVDAARGMVQIGVAEEDEIGLFGGSFGGYGVLIAMSKAPKRFKCGVALSPPVDLADLVSRVPDSVPTLRALVHTRFGDPDDRSDVSALAAQSPLQHVRAIERPLLIAYGANDPLVEPAKIERYGERLEARDKPVALLRFAEEGHGLADAANEQLFFAAAEAFYAECLGGKFERLRDTPAAGVTLSGDADLLPRFELVRPESS